jgi:hypothetical protein
MAQTSQTPDPQLERIARLYQKATENDWRTVQSTAAQAIAKHTQHRTTKAEVDELINVARSILAGENGHHLQVSGIDAP